MLVILKNSTISQDQVFQTISKDLELIYMGMHIEYKFSSTCTSCIMTTNHTLHGVRCVPCSSNYTPSIIIGRE